MRYQKAVTRAEVLNALSNFNEKVRYEAKRLNEFNDEDCYVIQYYNDKYVGIAAY